MEENYQFLCQLKERLSYKPGYSFLVRRLDASTALVSLRCPSLPDSNNPEDEAGLTINNTVILSKITSPADALHAFANVIADLELHEAAEFFKLDSKRIFMPHGWSEDSDDTNRFRWSDFRNLSGKFLYAIKQFIQKD